MKIHKLIGPRYFFGTPLNFKYKKVLDIINRELEATSPQEEGNVP